MPWNNRNGRGTASEPERAAVAYGAIADAGAGGAQRVLFISPTPTWRMLPPLPPQPPIRPMVTLLGLDPGLSFTGWGLIAVDGNRLRHIADGVIATDAATPVPTRLRLLHDALAALIATHRPDEAAVEETYVNRNGAATLKLGYARGIALLAPALAGIPVAEYGAKTVKLAVVGTGGAAKEQVQDMVRRLLPGATVRRADAADALAVAICHAHHRASRHAWAARGHPAPAA